MRKIILPFIIIMTMLFTTVFASAASADPFVAIISPANPVVYTNSLLVSVKVAKPRDIRVSVYSVTQNINGKNYPILDPSTLNKTVVPGYTLLAPSDTYSCINSLSFFTKQVTDLTPGTYAVKVETVDKSGKTLYQSTTSVLVREKTTDADAKIFESTQSGPMQFLQGVLKGIFGDN